MKPRLESAELTDEDCVALVFMGEKRGHCGMLEAHGRYLEADRRDADLMWRLSKLCPSCQFRVWSWIWSEQLGGSVWHMSVRDTLLTWCAVHGSLQAVQKLRKYPMRERTMKPRLGPAPLTKEDGDIWARVVNRSLRCFSSHDAGLYHRVTLGADRRDADLMYGIEKARQWEREHPEDFAEYVGMGWVHALVSTALQGCPMGFKDLDITYFA